MVTGNEISLKKMYITIRSRGGKSVAETAVWIDSGIENVLINRGEIIDVDSVQFHGNGEEASKRWSNF